MISVLETKKVIKLLNKLPKHIQTSYSYWRRLVEHNGIHKIREIKSYHFEKLQGERKGQYSCRLSRGYRVIFEIVNNKITIIVLEVNKHDY